MDRKTICVLGLAIAMLISSTSDAVAEESTSPTRLIIGTASDSVPAIFVQRRRRSMEWHQLKELEEYYDDLEDFYKKRDPALAEYYESWEKYYENVRKGKPAYLPPEIVIDRVPGDGPYFAPPGMETRQPRFASRQPIQSGPHTNLERSYRELQRQLARLNTGETWLRYLNLPFEEGQVTSLDLLMTEENKAKFAEALQRFDQTADDPEYQVIARLSAFDPTRNALRSFTQWLERQPTIAEPEEVIGEELPLTPPQEPQPPAEPQPPQEAQTPVPPQPPQDPRPPVEPQSPTGPELPPQ